MKSHACLYFPAGLSEARAASLAEACLRYSSQVAVRPGEAVLLETGKSGWLYSQASLERRLLRLAGPDAGALRLRFGASPAEALALARKGHRVADRTHHAAQPKPAAVLAGAA